MLKHRVKTGRGGCIHASWVAKTCALFAAQLPDASFHHSQYHNLVIAIVLTSNSRIDVKSNTTNIALWFSDSNKAIITFLKVIRPLVFMVEMRSWPLACAGNFWQQVINLLEAEYCSTNVVRSPVPRSCSRTKIPQ